MFKFKKVASLFASAAMLTSTVALAAAANYPGQFLQSGSAADTAIVHTSLTGVAYQSDLAAAMDLKAELDKLVTAKPTGNVNLEGGDSFQIERGSAKLNMGDAFATILGTPATLTKDDLPNLLADGTYMNDENTEYKYEQTITLGSHTLGFWKDSDYKDNTPSIGLNIASSTHVLNYTLSFNTQPESDQGSRLSDFETTNLRILGHDYYVLRADNGTNIKLTLLDAANSATVAQGETVSVKVGDKSYDVSIAYVSSTATRIRVNGETTNSLASGGTQRLSDGSYIGIKDILYDSKEAGVSQVEFSIGNGKLELTSGSEIKVNEKTQTGVTAFIARGSSSSTKEKLSSITIEWKTNERSFVTPEKELVLPGFQNVKLSMTEFVTPKTETTKVTYGATDYIQLNTELKTSGAVKIPILYANSSGEFKGIGKDSSNKLVTDASDSIVYNWTGGDRHVVASWASGTNAESYLIQFTNIRQDTDAGRNLTDIRVWENGEFVTKWTDKYATNQLVFTLGSLTINSVVVNGDEKRVNVSSSSTGASFNDLYTKEGLHIYLPTVGVNNSATMGVINFSNDATQGAGHSLDSFYLYFDEENKDGTIDGGTAFNVTLDDLSDGSVTVSTYDVGRTRLNLPSDSNHYVNYVYSELATKVEQIGDSSSQKEAIIEYYGGESYGKVFVAASSATSSSGGSSFNAIYVTDAESSLYSGKNLIVIGGSCVNTVAASLLGLSFPACGDTWQAKTNVGSGSWLIQTFSRDAGKVATLVAGYNAGDTTNAATYLKTQTPDVSTGKKYVGSTATSATVVTQ